MHQFTSLEFSSVIPRIQNKQELVIKELYTKANYMYYVQFQKLNELDSYQQIVHILHRDLSAFEVKAKFKPSTFWPVVQCYPAQPL